jgi:putative CocE/NonD family hydrolase
MAINAITEIQVALDVPVRMRDGVELRANVYRPASDGSYPVLLTRLPYGKDFPLGTAVLDPVQVARRGYIVVVQDVRGRFASDGDWYPMRHEAPDGYDTVQWAAQLPGSNGRVGMYGISYFGFTQLAAAWENPPALKAIFPMQTWADFFDGGSYRGGAFELGLSAYWLLEVLGIDSLMRRYRDDPELGQRLYRLAQAIDGLSSDLLSYLPLNEFPPFRDLDIAPSWFDALAHPLDRNSAAEAMVIGRYQNISAPAYLVASWYDILLGGMLQNYRGLRAQGATPAARQPRLLIGPWSHGAMNHVVGDRDFGFASSALLIDLKIDIASLQLRWFDYWLKDQQNGIMDEAPVKLFIMGENVWRDEQEWPLARTQYTPYYLHSQGRANSLHGDGLLSVVPPADEPADQYIYDPAAPVPTCGGALLLPPIYRPGPWDQRPVEQRGDVLVYSTPPLDRDVEVTGPIVVKLYAASSAPDTDFVARLVDVHPDGYAQNLTDGIIRARYRHGDTPELIEPGKVYEYTIDCWATGNLFRAGHRIRLDITSSSFPRWDRNPNTGRPPGSERETRPATQTILHNAAHPSHVILPIIPR